MARSSVALALLAGLLLAGAASAARDLLDKVDTMSAHDEAVEYYKSIGVSLGSDDHDGKPQHHDSDKHHSEKLSHWSPDAPPGNTTEASFEAAGAPGKYGLDQTADKKKCIDDPVEFIKVWNDPDPEDRDRCVSDSILVRLASGPSNLTETTRRFFSSLSIRPITFWTFKDGPEKYLRIGRPEILGSNVDALSVIPNGPDNLPVSTPYANARFPGVLQTSNGQALLDAIGFESAFIDFTSTYAIVAAKRPSPKVTPSYVPVWNNVATYFSKYISVIANDPSFEISDGVAQALTDNVFYKLTGCPAQCTWEDRAYPNSTISPPANTPAQIARHTSNTTCGPPNFIVDNNNLNQTQKDALIAALVDINGTDTTKRYRLGAPTSVDENDPLCDAVFKGYLAQFDLACKVPDRFTEVGIRNSAALFYKLYTTRAAAGATDLELAVIFRAYLLTPCAGDFNPLFSGTGFTSTGAGGIYAATVHEVLTGPIANVDFVASDSGPNKQEELQYALAFFCLDGTTKCCPSGDCSVPDNLITWRH